MSNAGQLALSVVGNAMWFAAGWVVAMRHYARRIERSEALIGNMEGRIEGLETLLRDAGCSVASYNENTVVMEKRRENRSS